MPGEFAQWLRDVMKRGNLSSLAVARLAKVTRKTVFAWLGGKGPRHPDAVRATLEKALGNQVEKPQSNPTGRQRRATDIRREPDLRTLLVHTEAELGPVFKVASMKDREEIWTHLYQQVSLLARLALSRPRENKKPRAPSSSEPSR